MPDHNDANFLHESTCPACGHHVSVEFLDRQRQPLATIAWPATAAAAQAMDELPLAFVRCVNCGHVYNREFDYANVPYSEKPNLMFNTGIVWTKHLSHVCDLLLGYLPDEPQVVEIGCGEGHLLRAMAQRSKNGRFIGFDPNTLTNTEGRFEARAELFVPSVHVAELRPDVIVSRHVLEHLVNPLGFLQSIAFAARWANVETRVFIEVPCVDRALESGRVVDFYYEHNSHFTTESFTRMLHETSNSVEMLLHSYNREVISGLVRVGARPSAVDHARESLDFRNRARRSQTDVSTQLDKLAASGKRVAVWGGTGKSAAFMNFYGADATRFPLVVDSDPDKAGTFVPGQGQEIQFRDVLRDAPVDVIIIPTQWRARDIAIEIKEAGISYQQILIEHLGRLIDFEIDVHPY